MPDNTEIPAEEIERLCEVMHDAYERAAVGAGWETQQASRKPWADVPEANKATMRAAVGALLEALPLRQPQIHFNEYTQMRVPGGPCNCVGRRQGDPHLDACPQRSAKAALPHLRVQETASKCLDCEHTHTADGCIGEPSPSDVWAGVTPSICDCPSLRVQETTAAELADDARVIATRLRIDSESIDREDTRIAVQNGARDVTRLAELISLLPTEPVATGGN